VFAALWLGVTAAHATPALDFPPECGTPADFERELKQRLGSDADVSSVLASISQGPTRYHLRVQIGHELRELDDASCSELFRASVVVAVAMLMHDREPPPKPAPPPPPPTKPKSPYPLFTVTAGAGVSVGTLPKPVFALELEGESLWQRFGVALNLRHLSPTQKLLATKQGADLSAFSGGVAGIFRPSRRWEARLGFAAQRLAAHGVGSAHNADDTAWAAGPTLGLGFVPLQSGFFWAGFGAEGQLNAIRGRFEIRNYSGMLSDSPQPVFQVPWLAGSAFVRLGLAW
jgi:hypothetical protein